MASESKFISMNQNLLLEFIYNSNNITQEDYHVVNNLNIERRGYASKNGLNSLSNTVFPIDPIIKKYARVDSSKYNFLKIENYSTQYLEYNKIRLHLPTTYSFTDNDYIGLYVRFYAYDYTNNKTVDLASYLYDDTQINADKNIKLNTEFLYNEQQWGKYITFNIPSVAAVSRQRTSTVNTNLPISNSVNTNLALIGLSQDSPIFVDFSWVISRQDILGTEYFFFSDITTKSVANSPEYQTLGVTIEESDNGDYFEIYGTYNNTNELLDDFVDEMTAKGRQIRIEYNVSLFEENLLIDQNTFLVTENFAKKIKYRPILTFTNTTAAIDVEMNVIDLFDSSNTIRIASIGLTNNIFKYGKTLNRINIDNAYNPKIYNQKVLNNASTGSENQTSNINLTKVNFPVIVDRIKILTSNSPSNTTEYKSMGLSEIIINPFGAILKFDIASEITDNNSIVPYDLIKITENSTVTLSFKTETEFLEKNIWQQTDQNDFKNGTILFKIDEQDLSQLKTISKDNKNFYLTIKGNKTGIRTLLYSGKFVFFEDISFIENSTQSDSINDINFEDFSNTQKLETVPIVNDNTEISKIPIKLRRLDVHLNAIILLNEDANSKAFEIYLTTINANIYFKRATGNNDIVTYMYYIIDISMSYIIEIKKQIEVSEVIELDFDIGKSLSNTINITDINNSIIGFNTRSS